MLMSPSRSVSSGSLGVLARRMTDFTRSTSSRGLNGFVM